MFNLYLTCLFSIGLLFAAPAIATAFTREHGFPSIIRFWFFVILQQLLFALGAALSHSYGLSILAAAFVILAVGGALARRPIPPAATVRPLWISLAPWFVCTVVFVGFAATRAQYSYLNFNNNGDEVGVEKLFNLSLQQSFLFGQSYPPEWVWLAGEPIRYYVFLKSIPGLCSWLARVVYSAPDTGGVFFIVFESLFTALTPALLCAWVLYFGRGASNQKTVATLGLLLACFCLVSTHFQALSLGLQSLLTHRSLDWWQLSHQVVPFTDNQYLTWFMLIGDSHAYMQVYSLQVLLWGSALVLLSKDRISVLGAAAVGALAAALVLAHPGSVLVTASAGTIFVILFAVSCAVRKHWRYFAVLAAHGVVLLIVACTFLLVLFESAGRIKAVPIRAGMTSPLVPFLNLQFSVLAWMALVFVCPLPGGTLVKRVGALLALREWFASLLGIITISLYLLDRSGLALMVLLGGVTYLCSASESETRRAQVWGLFATSTFGIWLLPELVAFDHVLDNRTDWIRFQMGLRFWPEGYVLIPFALTVAFIERFGEGALPRRWLTCVAVVVVLFGVSHISGFSNRISRVTQAASLNSFQEFYRRYPDDGQIVSFLRGLPADQRVVIAEGCGLGDVRVPVDFAWPGRLAAYSGRLGVCGWARHAMLYNNPLRQHGFKGTSVEERSATFLRCYLGFFSHILEGDMTQAELDLMGLKALGVTHLVFGTFEKKLFPKFSIDGGLESLSLKKVFAAANGMGVLELGQ